MNYPEYTAMTQNVKGGTEAVTHRSLNADTCKAELLKMGYHKVLWVAGPESLAVKLKKEVAA